MNHVRCVACGRELWSAATDVEARARAVGWAVRADGEGICGECRRAAREREWAYRLGLYAPAVVGGAFVWVAGGWRYAVAFVVGGLLAPRVKERSRAARCACGCGRELVNSDPAPLAHPCAERMRAGAGRPFGSTWGER